MNFHVDCAAFRHYGSVVAVRQFAAVRAAVCGSARGSVCAVRAAAVCGSALGSACMVGHVAVCGRPVVRQCAAVRVPVCGSARGYVRQCVVVCCS
jgi:hypothetical protein